MVIIARRIERGNGLAQSFHRSPESRNLNTVLLISTFLGLTIALLSSLEIEPISWVPLDRQFGLLQVLPWHFWLGFGLCLASLILGMRTDSEHVFLLKMAILFVLIWGIPVIFERNATVWDAYAHFSGGLEIMSTGIPKGNIELYSVNWPGAFIFFGVSKTLPNIDSSAYLRFFPIPVAALTIAVLHLFLRNYMSAPIERIALLAVSFLNVWFQFHVSPQAIGFILGMLTLLTIERSYFWWRVIALILFTAVLVSHATTMFIVVTAVSYAFVLRRIQNRKNDDQETSRRSWTPALLFIILALAWLFWNALGTSEALVRSLEAQVSQIFSMNQRVASMIDVRTTENIFPFPPLIRIVSIGLLILMSLCYVSCLVLGRLIKRDRNFGRAESVSWTLPVSLFAVSFFLAAADILVFGGQFYDRNILFVAIVSPMLGLRLATIFKSVKLTGSGWKRSARKLIPHLGTAVVALMIGAAFASLTTVFYQEDFYIVSDASFSAKDFLRNNIPAGSTIRGGIFPTDISGSPHPSIGGKSCLIVVLDIHDEIWKRQWLGASEYEARVEKTMIMDEVYSNGEYQLFWESV
jgi:hypothetical protein